LAANIVERYLDSYPGDKGITQSALEVERAEDVAEAVGDLATACMSALDSPGSSDEYVAFDKSAKQAQRFQIKDFVDLGDLCSQLIERSSEDAVKTAAGRVVQALNGVSPFVIQSGHKGPGMERATGAAIYLPLYVSEAATVNVAYEKLDFAKRTRWNELIAKYHAA
jgi:hypothetical protein